MKKLMKISTFRAQYFAAGEAPTEATIKKLIAEGEIAGQKIGSRYYVDAQKFELTDNELVNQVLLAS